MKKKKKQSSEHLCQIVGASLAAAFIWRNKRKQELEKSDKLPFLARLILRGMMSSHWEAIGLSSSPSAKVVKWRHGKPPLPAELGGGGVCVCVCARAREVLERELEKWCAAFLRQVTVMKGLKGSVSLLVLKGKKGAREFWKMFYGGRVSGRRGPVKEGCMLQTEAVIWLVSCCRWDMRIRMRWTLFFSRARA